MTNQPNGLSNEHSEAVATDLPDVSSGAGAQGLPGAPASDSHKPILILTGVVKRFGGASALSGVDFDLLAGEIHGLLGENGAGKSTLMKILSGVHSPDEGEIVLNGRSVSFSSPAGAMSHGIGMIYQELTTVPSLSVAENVFLGRQFTNRLGLVDWPRMRKEAKAALSALGIMLDVDQRMGSLSLGNQQLVEIARIINSGAEIIVMDEPTSALSGPEAERLFRISHLREVCRRA
ncbi:MAG TPA: ATP-binding cassette domain-containing protein, partial [Thermomicrobiales bacterium]|nr:ATP-binding cassette domain-containing protein [Thermomicrobiales bacterium]